MAVTGEPGLHSAAPSQVPAWRVRKAVAADEAAVLELTRRLADFDLPQGRSAQDVIGADHEQIRTTLRLPPPGHFLLVAESDPQGGHPEVLGCALVSIRRDFYTRIRHAHLEVLAVASVAEGRGIGRALLEEAEFRARASGFGFITLNVFTGNQRARGFYEARDYRLETLAWCKPLSVAAARPPVLPEETRVVSGCPEDEPELLALAGRLADFELPPWRTEREIARCKDSLIRAALRQEAGEAGILVARHACGEVLGFTLVAPRPDPFSGEQRAHLEVLVVAEDLEGTGVADALLRSTERQAAEAGYTVMSLGLFANNRRARSFYTRHGYEPELLGYRKPLDPDVPAQGWMSPSG